MRIGIDARLIGQTGVGRYILNLINNLSKVDKDNKYILFLRKEEFYHFKPPAGNFEKKVADFRWHSLREQLDFPKVLEKEHLDLVHFPYFSVPILYKGKYIVTIHDLILDHFDTGKATTLPLPAYKLKRFGYKFVLNKAIQNSIKIIAVSRATKKEITDHYIVNPKKISVIYEAAGFVNKSAQKNIFGDYLLYVGNAYPHKNLEKLIEAFKKLNINNLKLILAGPEDYFYKRLKEKEKSSLIIFKKSIGDEELSSLYQNAKALVMPSLMEGFGLTILEAMQYNLPIAASRIPSIQEIAGDSINYFNPESTEDIKESLLKTLNTKPKNYEKILDKYSWSNTAHKTLELYDKSCNF